jgi:hypothetical protein
MKKFSITSKLFTKFLLISATTACLYLPATDYAAAHACPRFCPLFLTKYCARFPNGSIHTVETNPCLACKRGWRLLYRGACHRPFTPR